MNDKECKKGKTCTELCSYAHGHEDMKGYLPPESRPLNWKTKLCNTKYKHDEINCGYAHLQSEATKNLNKMNNELSSYDHVPTDKKGRPLNWKT